MEEKIDITTLLRMASEAACDPRHRQTLTDAIDEIVRLREALEEQIELWEVAEPLIDYSERFDVPFMKFHNPISKIKQALEGGE